MNYLTVTEAAAAARCHRETLAEALRAGELHGFQRRKGASWKIHTECLNAWVESRSCAHATDNKVAA